MSSTVDAIDNTFSLIELDFDNKPQILQSQHQLTTWITIILHSVTTSVKEYLSCLSDCIDRFEQAPQTVSTPSVTLPTSAPMPTAVLASTPRARTSHCSLCHAHSHLHTDCHTTNPSAMQKRVVRNSHIAKEAHTYTAAQPPIDAYPPYPFAAAPSPVHTAPAPMAYAALAADTTEL
jgi:hypothetical protein